MPTNRLCVGLLLVLLQQSIAAFGQSPFPYFPNSSYTQPVGIAQLYGTVAAATTPVVVLNTTGFVGTSLGVIGGSAIATSSSIFFPTPFPVTTLFNVSATQMVAIANDTLYSFNETSTLWQVTQVGFQFDFAVSYSGQSLLPLVNDNMLFVGTASCCGEWESLIFAIDWPTGKVQWKSTLPVANANYPIQLGSDQNTLVARGSTVFSTSIYLMNGETGAVASFTAPLGRQIINQSPLFALYEGILWVFVFSSNYMQVEVFNTHSNAPSTLVLEQLFPQSNGWSVMAPFIINDIIYFAFMDTIYMFGATNFSVIGNSSSGTSTLDQVVPYTDNGFIFCGASGLEVFSLSGGRAFSFGIPFFEYNNGYVVQNCDGLSWGPDGLLIANYGLNVYGLDVASGVVVWQTYTNGDAFLGNAVAISTPDGVVFAIGHQGPNSQGAPALQFLQDATSTGWMSSISSSGFAVIGAPYDVIVVQSVADSSIFVVAPSDGSVIGTYSIPVEQTDSLPVQVGEFACSTSYYRAYVYCVPLAANKQSFQVLADNTTTPMIFAVDGSTLYRIAQDYWGTSQMESLDTSASSPSFTITPLPATVNASSNPTGALFVGQNGEGETVLYGALVDGGIFGLNVARPIATWGTGVSGAAFSTTVVQVPGDRNVFVGGSDRNGFGLLKFDAAKGTLVTMYTFPSVQGMPMALLADTNIIVIIGSINITACDSHGHQYWSRTLPGVTAANLQLSVGAAFVTVAGASNILYKLNADTGDIEWMNEMVAISLPAQSVHTSTSWSTTGFPAFAVNDLVLCGSDGIYAFNLGTGELVVEYTMGAGVASPGLGVLNTTGAFWAFGGSIGSSLFGAIFG